MTTPSFIIGNKNWAIKEDFLLGYANAPTSSKIVPRAISTTRVSDAWTVDSSGSYSRVPWNITSYSQDFTNAAWTKSNTTVTSSVIIAPDGTLTGTQVTIGAGTAQKYVGQSRSYAVSSSYTFSVYAKKGTNNFVQLAAPNGGFGVNVWANFDLNTGTLGSSGSASTSSIEDVGNGWYRCSLTGQAINIASSIFFIANINSSTDVRIPIITNIGETIYIWGAQMVEGSRPLPYLPTTDRANVQRVD